MSLTIIKNCLSVLCLAMSATAIAVDIAPAVAANQIAHHPEVVAHLNGTPVHKLTLEVLTQMAQLENPKTVRADILDNILSNRLLAEDAREKFAEEELQASRRVAFEPDVMLDNQLSGYLRTVYRKDLETAISKLPGGRLDALIQEHGKLDEDQLNAVFGARNRIMLDYSLNPTQQTAATHVLVLRSNFAAASSISLYAVFRRQNVQGRVEFFNRNRDFIRQQAQLYLANLYVLDWARQRFGESALSDLRRALQEKNSVQAVMSLHGIGADTDSESRLLNQLAAEVKPKEVQAYFHSHKEEFKRIVSVKARHIRLDNEEQARQVSELAHQGANFASLAKQYSTAPDAQQGGDMGLIAHRGQLSWLEQLAYMQEPGKVSPPIRTAVAPNETAHWEIVLVEKRNDGYQDPASETVRYLASRAIAQEKAIRQLSSLQAQLRKSAKIEINQAALLN
ncbi:peptidylprolyl isomerase [Undibacterium umbellatum]|uniref:peptidylprolyl isomerase n=1 Tax=Undibacterium umbellatum TaxID=2762300 RepID=A0ABR6Z3A4_9BURK|nr:peptidylprolyl isomerase [Undibacterium umbellatum]MBC3906098.1 peptidylprolyl isomerase [Undibacterium umbellatum]